MFFAEQPLVFLEQPRKVRRRIYLISYHIWYIWKNVLVQLLMLPKSDKIFSKHLPGLIWSCRGSGRHEAGTTLPSKLRNEKYESSPKQEEISCHEKAKKDLPTHWWPSLLSILFLFSSLPWATTWGFEEELALRHFHFSIFFTFTFSSGKPLLKVRVDPRRKCGQATCPLQGKYSQLQARALRCLQ